MLDSLFQTEKGVRVQTNKMPDITFNGGEGGRGRGGVAGGYSHIRC